MVFIQEVLEPDLPSLVVKINAEKLVAHTLDEPIMVAFVLQLTSALLLHSIVD
jgi:hypothetical protein